MDKSLYRCNKKGGIWIKIISYQNQANFNNSILQYNIIVWTVYMKELADQIIFSAANLKLDIK